MEEESGARTPGSALGELHATPTRRKSSRLSGIYSNGSSSNASPLASLPYYKTADSASKRSSAPANAPTNENTSGNTMSAVKPVVSGTPIRQVNRRVSVQLSATAYQPMTPPTPPADEAEQQNEFAGSVLRISTRARGPPPASILKGSMRSVSQSSKRERRSVVFGSPSGVVFHSDKPVALGMTPMSKKDAAERSFAIDADADVPVETDAETAANDAILEQFSTQVTPVRVVSSSRRRSHGSRMSGTPRPNFDESDSPEQSESVTRRATMDMPDLNELLTASSPADDDDDETSGSPRSRDDRRGTMDMPRLSEFYTRDSPDEDEMDATMDMPNLGELISASTPTQDRTRMSVDRDADSAGRRATMDMPRLSEFYSAATPETATPTSSVRGRASTPGAESRRATMDAPRLSEFLVGNMDLDEDSDANDDASSTTSERRRTMDAPRLSELNVGLSHDDEEEDESERDETEDLTMERLRLSETVAASPAPRRSSRGSASREKAKPLVTIQDALQEHFPNLPSVAAAFSNVVDPLASAPGGAVRAAKRRSSFAGVSSAGPSEYSAQDIAAACIGVPAERAVRFVREELSKTAMGRCNDPDYELKRLNLVSGSLSAKDVTDLASIAADHARAVAEGELDEWLLKVEDGRALSLQANVSRLEKDAEALTSWIQAMETKELEARAERETQDANWERVSTIRRLDVREKELQATCREARARIALAQTQEHETTQQRKRARATLEEAQTRYAARTPLLQSENDIKLQISLLGVLEGLLPWELRETQRDTFTILSNDERYKFRAEGDAAVRVVEAEASKFAEGRAPLFRADAVLTTKEVGKRLMDELYLFYIDAPFVAA